MFSFVYAILKILRGLIAGTGLDVCSIHFGHTRSPDRDAFDALPPVVSKLRIIIIFRVRQACIHVGIGVGLIYRDMIAVAR